MLAPHEYFVQSEKEQSLVLPLFQKIFECKLILVDYHLDLGLVKALKNGFVANPGVLDMIHIDNCGINEEASGYLIEAASRLERLRSFTLKNQEFGL